MSKNKELADYIMDQLSDLGNVSGTAGKKTKKEKRINCGKSIYLSCCKLYIICSMNTLLMVMVSGG